MGNQGATQAGAKDALGSGIQDKELLKDLQRRCVPDILREGIEQEKEQSLMAASALAAPAMALPDQDRQPESIYRKVDKPTMTTQLPLSARASYPASLASARQSSLRPAPLKTTTPRAQLQAMQTLAPPPPMPLMGLPRADSSRITPTFPRADSSRLSHQLRSRSPSKSRNPASALVGSLNAPLPVTLSARGELLPPPSLSAPIMTATTTTVTGPVVAHVPLTPSYQVNNVLAMQTAPMAGSLVAPTAGSLVAPVSGSLVAPTALQQGTPSFSPAVIAPMHMWQVPDSAGPVSHAPTPMVPVGSYLPAPVLGRAVPSYAPAPVGTTTSYLPAPVSTTTTTSYLPAPVGSTTSYLPAPINSTSYAPPPASGMATPSQPAMVSTPLPRSRSDSNSSTVLANAYKTATALGSLRAALDKTVPAFAPSGVSVLPRSLSRDQAAADIQRIGSFRAPPAGVMGSLRASPGLTPGLTQAPSYTPVVSSAGVTAMAASPSTAEQVQNLINSLSALPSQKATLPSQTATLQLPGSNSVQRAESATLKGSLRTGSTKMVTFATPRSATPSGRADLRQASAPPLNWRSDSFGTPGTSVRAPLLGIATATPRGMTPGRATTPARQRSVDAPSGIQMVTNFEQAQQPTTLDKAGIRADLLGDRARGVYSRIKELEQELQRLQNFTFLPEAPAPTLDMSRMNLNTAMPMNLNVTTTPLYTNGLA